MDVLRNLARSLLLLSGVVVFNASVLAVGYNPGNTTQMIRYQSTGASGGVIGAMDLQTCTVPEAAMFGQCASQAFSRAVSRLGIPKKCTPSSYGIASASLVGVSSGGGVITSEYLRTVWDKKTGLCVLDPTPLSGNWLSTVSRVCPSSGGPYTSGGSNGQCYAPDFARGMELQSPAQSIAQSTRQTPSQTCSIDNRSDGMNRQVLDPIDIGTGNVAYQENDVTLAGGLLSFTRYYNSNESFYDLENKPTVSYALGNWRGDFLAGIPGGGGAAIKLTFEGSGDLKGATATVTRPDGRNIVYRSTYNSLTRQFTTPWTSSETVLQMASIPGDSAWAALTLSDGQGLTENFSAVGTTEARLSSISDADGILLNIVRAGAKVTSVTDRFGNRLDFEYLSRAGIYVLYKLKVNGSLWATYAYNSIGYLSSVAYADGNCRLYFYDDANFPIGLSRVETKVCASTTSTAIASWSYDALGRAVANDRGGVMAGRVEYADRPMASTGTGWMWFETEDGQMGYTRAPSGSPDGEDRAVVTLPNGLMSIYTLGTFGNKERVTRKTRTVGSDTAEYLTTYDNNGNIASTRDWRGNVTTYVHDSRNLETSRTEAVGTPQARTTTTEWHATLRMPVRITTPTRETVFTYAGDKLVTRTESDLTGLAADSRTWTYSYTAQGLLQSVDGPLAGAGDTTSYAYNSAGRLTSVTNALGHVTRITEHSLLGYPQTIVDANGVKLQLAYNPRGRLTSFTLVEPDDDNRTTTTAVLDADGNITRVTQPDGVATDYEYNAIGNVMAVEDATGARIEYERDAEGNIVRTHVRNAGGVLIRRLDQLRDGLRNITEVAGVNGTHATYEYDRNGNALRAADGLAHATQNAFDALDRLIRSTDANGAETTYGYDAEGNLATVTDARGLTTRYDHDGFGCLRKLSSPDTGVTEFTCDAAGNVTSRTDARGVTTTYGYDLLNRLTSAVYSNAPGEMALYGYDATAGGNKGIGRLTAAQNDGADIARKYDARGNLVEDRHTINGQIFVTSYGYDISDRLVSLTYPSGRVVTYLRNTAGQVNSVTTSATGTGSQTVASNIVWVPFGGIESLAYGNGLAETRTYDSDSALTRIAVGALMSRDYERDAAGRIVAINDADPLASETYGYSDVDRLVAANGPYGTRTYTWDDVGNRKTLSVNSSTTTYEHDVNSNRLSKIVGTNTANPAYDAAGNTLARSGMTFTYNAANRLKTAKVPDPANGSLTYTYAYNALGERVAKTSTLGTTYFHYDLQGRLLAESDAAGAVIREYIWLDSKPLGVIAKRNTGTQYELFAVHTDHLDTALLLTDSAQRVVWNYDRDPFGATVAGSNRVRWPLRFPGQYADQETGFFYNYYRDYDPATGRYIESDPIGLGGGVNTYAYAGGSPTSNVDPTGELFFVPMLVNAGLGALTDIGEQLLENGGNAGCIDYGQVAAAAGMGAVGGGGFSVLAKAKRVAKVAVGAPIIVGENMKRVNEYAEKVGGHAYRPWKNSDPFDFDLGMKRNERWIQDQIRSGREVIDIGPDFRRRSASGRNSPFYEMERRVLNGYDNYKKVFERNGNKGGVPGLDY